MFNTQLKHQCGQQVETGVLYFDRTWLHFWGESDITCWLLLREEQNSPSIILYGLLHRRLPLFLQVMDELFKKRRAGADDFRSVPGGPSAILIQKNIHMKLPLPRHLTSAGKLSLRVDTACSYA